MSRHRRTAITGAPLTTVEMTGTEFVGKDRGKPITCFECGLGSGTLVGEKDKDDNRTGRYYHQDVRKCQLLKARKEVKGGRGSKTRDTKALPRAGRARQGGKDG